MVIRKCLTYIKLNKYLCKFMAFIDDLPIYLHMGERSLIGVNRDGTGGGYVRVNVLLSAF